ncbi:signal peptidase II [Cellulosimicrobium cellulans]|uniref:Lipoprotein signal peptidase n=1 Tax=Cellulosimicrobium cellulans TaxID=1710 RepID=A0A1Y0HXF6_CELCE|nr:signal peptidase II [Cellulosimicrobium cellulans]ARU52878.1 signal peptidase II [Cellulosimicrobium cellulans]
MSTSARPEPTEPADAAAGTDPGGASVAEAGTETGAVPGTEAGTAAQGPRRVLVVWTVVLAVLVLALDQLTKWWAESSLTLGDDTIPLLGSLLGLRLIYNPGAALSIATGMTWLLTIVVVAVVVVIVRMVSRIGSRAWAVALGLLLGGALGNLVDRFFREPGFARGHVVDFIAYANWFVGNVADIAIVGAAVMIAVLSVLGIGLDGTRHGGDDKPEAEATDDEPEVPAVVAEADADPGPAPEPGPTTVRADGEEER